MTSREFATSVRSRLGRVELVGRVGLLAVVCGGQACYEHDCTPTTGPSIPQDCGTLASQDWFVSVAGTGSFGNPEVTLAVGNSAKATLFPILEDQCEGTVASTTWSLQPPSVASFVPEGRRGWITGAAPGTATLTARITFADGKQLDALPRPIRVVPREGPPRGGIVVGEGTLRIAPYVPPGNTARDWSGWAQFSTTTAGRLDVVVDWTSVLNRIDFSGYEGHCNSVGTCGMIRLIVRQYDIKPLTSTFDDPRTPPGDYTIRIDNLGPAEETVHYEVRLTPS